MKKILLLLASFGLTATTTVSIVACGTNNPSEVIKVNLQDLNLNLELTQSYSDQTDAFQAFLKLNPEVSDLEANVQIGSFVAPNDTTPGFLVVIAGQNSEYTGLITIKIPAIEITDLNKLGLISEVDGTKAMLGDNSGETVLSAFLIVNEEKYPDLDLRNNIKIQSYADQVDYGHIGRLVVEGTNKYEGTLQIFITKILVTDEEIVNTAARYVNFEATMRLSQSLDDFIDNVLLGKRQLKGQHWYLKSQLTPLEDEYPVFKAIDYDKFEFLGLYLLDKTSLDDAYIRDQNLQSGFVLSLYVKFNYGTVQGSFMRFSLLFQ